MCVCKIMEKLNAMTASNYCDKLHNIISDVSKKRNRAKVRGARTRRSDAFAKNFGLALYEVVENKRSLFSCPICRGILTAPVTGNCGHTFCAGCFDIANASRCISCISNGEQVQHDQRRSTNVLVQSICNKWRETHPKHLECRNTSADILGFEPRYSLRSRQAGLLTRNDCQDSIVTRTVRLLLTKRVSERRKDRRIISERELNKIIHYVDLIQERHLRTSWKHLDPADLECVLCSRIFHEPITTHCGHTFCRGCLARVIDHGLGCPLCMSSLGPFDECNGITKCVDDAIKFLYPRAFAERRRALHKELKLNNAVPVFVCTNAFPGVACPLYVYEPRYRLLARRCLQSKTRRFAMAARLDQTHEKFATYGTILEVKDAVHLYNGTSILTTVGVRRFKVISKGEHDGYDTATVQYIKDINVTSEKLPEILELHRNVYNKAARWVKSLTPRVLSEVENCIGEMPPLEEQWYNLPDGPAWAWWLMPILPLSSKLQIGFLCTTDLEKRLRAIDKLLEHMKIKMRALKRNTLKCNDTVESADSCRMSWLI